MTPRGRVLVPNTPHGPSVHHAYSSNGLGVPIRYFLDATAFGVRVILNDRFA